MKVVVASVPIVGHVNSMLSISKILKQNGHQVLAYTASTYGQRFKALGADFSAFPRAIDYDLTDSDGMLPDRRLLAPGIDRLLFDWEHVLIDPMMEQYAGLLRLLDDFPADIILCDNLFMGTLPMLLGKNSSRPAIVHCGITCLSHHRDDGAPFGLGLPPASTEKELREYEFLHAKMSADFFHPVQDYLNEELINLGLGPLTMPLLDANVTLPDLFLQPTVPEFEYPRRTSPGSLRFIGAMPLPPVIAPEPLWLDNAIRDRRSTILVTQGTGANQDLSQLVEPALAALADRDDIQVLVTTGGRPLSAISGSVPANARIASYLPFDKLMSRADLLITNGGYGSVNYALSHGVPVVAAGTGEDKAEVGTRVTWSGTGTNLTIDHPSSGSLRQAIDKVFESKSHREKTELFAQSFARYDVQTAMPDLLERLVS